MLRTGQLIHPASHPASQRRTGASLPGTLASPGTGLTPAGCPELQEHRPDRPLQRPNRVPSWAHANIRSMPTYSYTVAEYDPVTPWVVLGPLRRMTVELDADENFFEWAALAWPRPRYEVTLDPWQLSPER
jgi:hypothetical protein